MDVVVEMFVKYTMDIKDATPGTVSDTDCESLTYDNVNVITII